MAERVYLSIGEVLSLLQAEFPDVTISKIRFLESQGLLDPERTPSGYRKFYDTDVERLRWILRQQRENFLPLKVIKGRLLGQGDGSEDSTDGTEPGPVEAPPIEAPLADPERPDPQLAEPQLAEPQVAEPQPGASQPAESRPEPAPPEHVAPEPRVQTPKREAVRAEPPRRRLSVTDLPLPLSGASLTLEELAAASGQPPDRIRDLEKAGFIVGRSVADVVYYDEESLSVADLVGGFARFGIEPRHLRIYKNSAEREAGLFQQVIVPLLKQRNPEARQRAIDSLEELSHLGERLRTTMLRQAIKGLTGG
jgi:DNA-binding transcriptional MerR regulator